MTAKNTSSKLTQSVRRAKTKPTEQKTSANTAPATATKPSVKVEATSTEAQPTMASRRVWPD